jgi:hypothetical protein
MLTRNEQAYCDDILKRINRLRDYLKESNLNMPVDSKEWYKHLSTFKDIQGNLNNYVSFIATLMAKEYISSKFSINGFDAAEKPQGAPGLDIDIKAKDGKRIIAEVKTIYPYQIDDFGANQKKSFEKDFAKLNKEKAAYKFLFVTESKSFNILKRDRYSGQIPGVKIVLLPSGEEYNG